MDLWRMRIALSNGGAVHLHACGLICAGCGGDIDEHAELMSYIDSRSQVYPCAICSNCRGRLRADLSFYKLLEASIARRVTGIYDIGGRAS